jgi:hypothetical protein
VRKTGKGQIKRMQIVNYEFGFFQRLRERGLFMKATNIGHSFTFGLLRCSLFRVRKLHNFQYTKLGTAASLIACRVTNSLPGAALLCLQYEFHMTQNIPRTLIIKVTACAVKVQMLPYRHKEFYFCIAVWTLNLHYVRQFASFDFVVNFITWTGTRNPYTRNVRM